MVLWLIALMTTISANAQSNSLFKRNRGPAVVNTAPSAAGPNAVPAAGLPGAQPSTGQTTVAVAGVAAASPTRFQHGFSGLPAGPAIRHAPGNALDPQSNPNPALLAISPIAVAAPQKEKIQRGALVMIIVREVKQALSDSQLKTDKKWDVQAVLNEWIRLDERQRLVPQNFPRGNPQIDFGVNDKYEGRGRVDRRDELTTRITATVIDVKPNGTLILEAKKSIALDEESQVYTLSGKCRADDLTPQNTILSTQIADMELSVQHSGAARDASRRSIWKRLSDLFQLS